MQQLMKRIRKSNRENLLQKFVATVNILTESSGPHHIHGSSGINSFGRY